LRKQPDRVKAKRFISAHVWMLNVAHATFPDAAERFVADVGGCREVQDAFVTKLKIPSIDARENDGSLWLQPRAKIYTKVADALIASGMVTAALARDVFGGRDPSKVDPELSRTAAGTRAVDRDGVHRTDVDRRLRLRSNPSVAPRFDDPRCFDRLHQALIEIGASEAVQRTCGMARFAGARACQALALTLHDVLVMPKAGKVGKHIASPNKGSHQDREMTLIPGDAEMERNMQWIDGERARLSGMSLAELRLIAADPRRRDTLKAMPLYTEDGVSFLKYQRLYKVFRRAATRAGLWIDDDDHRQTGRRRYVTFHYLRHEYVHRRLDALAQMPTLLQQINERKAIIAYMKWRSGEAMLAWYSAHHVVKVSAQAAEQYNALTDAGIASTATRPLDDDRALAADMLLDELMEGLA